MSRFRGIAYVALGLVVTYHWFGDPEAKQPPRPAAENATTSDAKGTAIVPDAASLPSDKLEIVGAARYVTASSLRVRAGPSASAEILGSLARGTRVLVIDSAGEWFNVSIPGERRGWAHGDYLSIDAPPTPASIHSAPTPVAPERQDAIVSTRATPGSEAIAQKLIERSIASYPGSCACPYNRDRAGRSCGRRSAYSRPGGESPLCFRSDVTNAMIEAHR